MLRSEPPMVEQRRNMTSAGDGSGANRTQEVARDTLIGGTGNDTFYAWGPGTRWASPSPCSE